MRRLVAAVVMGAALVGGSGRAAAAEPIPASETDVGYLDIASDPPAKVLIDDADTGKVTPQTHFAVKAGHHKLTLVTLDGARTRSFGFTVEAGQTRKFTVHLAS
ncbi:MAG TPA: PEGA domain-containing protein [Polyangiaceae bacterium]|jgi:hypothetical protein|nr:PEGA domain-containing protein [Polyangiaceae bacterium]